MKMMFRSGTLCRKLLRQPGQGRRVPDERRVPELARRLEHEVDERVRLVDVVRVRRDRVLVDPQLAVRLRNHELQLLVPLHHQTCRSLGNDSHHDRAVGQSVGVELVEGLDVLGERLHDIGGGAQGPILLVVLELLPAAQSAMPSVSSGTSVSSTLPLTPDRLPASR